MVNIYWSGIIETAIVFSIFFAIDKRKQIKAIFEKIVHNKLSFGKSDINWQKIWQKVVIFIVVMIIGIQLSLIGTLSYPFIDTGNFFKTYFWCGAIAQGFSGIFFGWIGILAGTLFPAAAGGVMDGTMGQLMLADFIQSFLPFFVMKIAKFSPYELNKKTIFLFIVGCVFIPNIIGGLLGCGILYGYNEINNFHGYFVSVYEWAIGNILPSSIFGLFLLKTLWRALADSGLTASSENFPIIDKTICRQSIFIKALLGTVLGSVGPILIVGIYELIQHKSIFGQASPSMIMLGVAIILALMVSGIIFNHFICPIKIFVKNMENYRLKKQKPNFDNIERKDEFGFMFHEYEKMIEEIDDYEDELKKNAHLSAIGSTITMASNELRTPLSTINAHAVDMKKYLPILVETYKGAQETPSVCQAKNIRKDHLQVLSQGVDKIEGETKSLFKIIDMLLANVSQEKIHPKDFEICSISSCIDHAVARYPFRGNQRDCVNINIKQNKQNEFLFKGTEVLIEHVLFNLMKNALYYIEAKGEGEVTISLMPKDSSSAYNALIFKDTGKGIAPDILSQIFDHFFSRTHHGIGIGLAYCKMVMEAFGGEIACESEEGVYTKFILKFPKI